MKRNLHWKMFTAFGLVILLTALLSITLSMITTANRFDLFISNQGQIKAAEMAPLLSEFYRIENDWTKLSAWLDTEPEWSQFENYIQFPYFSNLDWWELTAEEMGMTSQELYDLTNAYPNLSEVILSTGHNPQQITKRIKSAETQQLHIALQNGVLNQSQYDSNLVNLEAIIQAFFNEPIINPSDGYFYSGMYNIQQDASFILQWDEDIAQFLNLDIITFYDEVNQGKSIAQMTNNPEINLSKLAVQLEEKQTEIGLPVSNQIILNAFSQPLNVFSLNYISQNQINAYFTQDNFTQKDLRIQLMSYMNEDERLIITDLDGNIKFDSVDQNINKRIDQEMIHQGARIYDQTNGLYIANVLIASGPAFYTAQQTRFLQSINLSLLISFTIAAIIALGVSYWFSKQITQPVTALTEASEKITRGDWGDPLNIETDDELGQMGTTFNSMVQELNTQRELRSKLIDDVAHELSTPLTVIQLETQALKDEMQTPQEAAEHILNEINLLRNMIGDLSLLSETDKGAITLECGAQDIVEIAQSSLARWQVATQERNIILRIKEPQNPLPLVWGDDYRLSQVFNNLISNAIHHTPSGGMIEIDFEVINAIRGKECPATVVIAIRDNGVGICEADQPYIFERFYRVDPSRSRKTGGQGLGLSIVKKIVHLHGGQVWVESEEGKGSTFRFSVPAQVTKQPSINLEY